MICVAFPTIMDGLVLRWYTDQAAWDRSREIASASRNCCVIQADCSPEIRRLADQAHSYLAVEYAAHLHPSLDVRRWATHHPRTMFSRELVALYEETKKPAQSCNDVQRASEGTDAKSLNPHNGGH